MAEDRALQAAIYASLKGSGSNSASNVDFSRVHGRVNNVFSRSGSSTANQGWNSSTRASSSSSSRSRGVGRINALQRDGILPVATRSSSDRGQRRRSTSSSSSSSPSKAGPSSSPNSKARRSKPSKGNPRDIDKPRYRLSTRARRRSANGGGRDRGDASSVLGRRSGGRQVGNNNNHNQPKEDKRLGYGWMQMAGCGLGRFKWGASHTLQLEGREQRLFMVTRQDSREANIIQSNLIGASGGWLLELEAKCVGKLHILLDAVPNASSYVAVVLDTAHKGWYITLKGEGDTKEQKVGVVQDSTLFSKDFYTIQIEVSGRNVSLVVDGHCFFENLHIPHPRPNSCRPISSVGYSKQEFGRQIPSARDRLVPIQGLVGLACAKAKAHVRNWRISGIQRPSVLSSGNATSQGQGQGDHGNPSRYDNRQADNHHPSTSHPSSTSLFNSFSGHPGPRAFASSGHSPVGNTRGIISGATASNPFASSTNSSSNPFPPRAPLHSSSSSSSSSSAFPARAPLLDFSTPSSTHHAFPQHDAATNSHPSYQQHDSKSSGGTASHAYHSSHSDTPVSKPRPRYNDGDPALVEMIESNIIERDLGITFDDIASLDDAKRLLHEAVVIPLVLPDFFTGIREPWKGVLLHGPPGTGKTMLAKAVAGVAECRFFNVSPSVLTSKWRGESEKLVRTLFDMARYYAPSIIFFDEIDSMLMTRGSNNEHEASRRFKSMLFSEIDGINSTKQHGSGQSHSENMVMVLATTNRPWDLDDAMRRRLEKRIYIPLPDSKAREEMFNIFLKDVKLDSTVSLKDLAEQTESFSGADIRLLCRDASMVPMRRMVQGKSIQEIRALHNSSALDFALSKNDFDDTLKRLNPSVDTTDLDQFAKWQAEFGSL